MFKNMLIVDKFLCFTLETGGLVISWFLLCVFTIAEFIIGYSFVKTLIECKNRKKQETNDENDSSCYKTNSTVTLALFAIAFGALIVVCCFCIKGTKERNYRLVKPLMVTEGIFSVCCVISIVGSPLQGIIVFILNAYMFITLYSFYLQLNEENESAQAIELPESGAKWIDSKA